MKEIVAVRLEAVAALARTLAYDYREGKLWPGDFRLRAAQIKSELEAAGREVESG